MFGHVSVLLSFVYAIAVSHILVSVTELIWARDRVRVSWLQALWMFNALLFLLVNWVGMWLLSQQAQWSVADIAISFTSAVVQYFTCSLLSIRPRDDGPVDMPAFYARQRPFVFAAFFVLVVVSMFQNWWERHILPAPDAWIYVDATLLPMLAIFVVAGVARAVWLQWIAGAVATVMAVYFLATFALGMQT